MTEWSVSLKNESGWIFYFSFLYWATEAWNKILHGVASSLILFIKIWTTCCMSGIVLGSEDTKIMTKPLISRSQSTEWTDLYNFIYIYIYIRTWYYMAEHTWPLLGLLSMNSELITSMSCFTLSYSEEEKPNSAQKKSQDLQEKIWHDFWRIRRDDQVSKGGCRVM